LVQPLLRRPLSLIQCLGQGYDCDGGILQLGVKPGFELPSLRCGAMALAIKIFLALHWKRDADLPNSLFFEAGRAQSSFHADQKLKLTKGYNYYQVRIFAVRKEMGARQYGSPVPLTLSLLGSRRWLIIRLSACSLVSRCHGRCLLPGSTTSADNSDYHISRYNFASDRSANRCFFTPGFSPGTLPTIDDLFTDRATSSGYRQYRNAWPGEPAANYSSGTRLLILLYS
jgi:hypothetical protein